MPTPHPPLLRAHRSLIRDPKGDQAVGDLSSVRCGCATGGLPLRLSDTPHPRHRNAAAQVPNPNGRAMGEGDPAAGDLSTATTGLLPPRRRIRFTVTPPRKFQTL